MCPWFADADEDEQSGCGYRNDMIAQFKQDLNNKNFSLQDQCKHDEIDTLENRNKFWVNIISNAQGSVPDNLFDYDFNDEGLENSVSGANIFLETGELKKILYILRSKGLRNHLKFL